MSNQGRKCVRKPEPKVGSPAFRCRFDFDARINLRIDPQDKLYLEKVAARLGEGYAVADIVRLALCRLEPNMRHEGSGWLKAEINKMRRGGGLAYRPRTARGFSAFVTKTWDSSDSDDGGTAGG